MAGEVLFDTSGFFALMDARDNVSLNSFAPTSSRAGAAAVAGAARPSAATITTATRFT